ncbi:hypothetical protein QFC22_002246 [Naganishia vaughanmartiniae]|uniref:Uncharacterized protein n=1 Tax=Naganishia vaughanmartiniae TaxID=1424756 RepID=A0ACC2XDA6_9TREE|nr:hypothetical protein QFC22_002246 [Naganishia vaughanmartiniae]
MRAEVEGGLYDEPATPTINTKSPWLRLNDGNDTVILDEPGMDAMFRGKVSSQGITDELDSTTYGYALRVAYINNILRQNLRVNVSGATSPISPRLQTPITATGSPTSYFSSGPPTPGVSTTPVTSSTPDPQNRKSSIFGRRKSIGNPKERETHVDASHGEAGGKLPKEVLSNGFWDVLANEGGDASWRTTVNTLLSHLPNKKATKTNSGTNLRYIPSLIDAFANAYVSASASVSPLKRATGIFISSPNTVGGISPTRPAATQLGDEKSVHVIHFIALLQTALSNHFSPLNKKVDEKDREMFAKLQAELDNYVSTQDFHGDRVRPGTSPTSNDPRMSRLSFSSVNNSAPLSPPLSSIPPVPALPSAYLYSPASQKRTSSAPTSPLDASPRSAHSRIPTPTEMSRVASQTSTATSYKSSFSGGFEDPAGVDLVEVVRRTWNVDGEKLKADLDSLRRAGLDEKTYLSDLKQHLIDLKAESQSGNSSQDRISALQAEISGLMHGRPDLAGLTLTSRSSVYTVGSESDSGSGVHLFFTPSNNKEKIFKRLAERIHLVLEYDTPLATSMYGERQLLDLCAGVWDIREKTALQLDAVAEIWKGSIEKAQFDEERVGVNRSHRNAAQQIALEQNGWAQRVVEAMKELEQDVSSGLDDKTVIPYIAHALFNSRKVLSIYPATSKSAWGDAADELRAVAVSEYAMQTALFIQSNGDILKSQEQTEDGLKGYEQLADWIACGVERAMNAWRGNIIDLLNPPSIILSKQLPLFLAELQAFDQPQPGRKADVIFGLYEKTARLLSLWEDVCPDTECGFDMDSFFEPHVREWLKTTEEVETYEWVTRAVGMDSTSSTAITQYATTVQNLFIAELHHANDTTASTTEAAPAVSGKASAWLAKSKLAIKSLERKNAEAFNIPPTACVKITNLIAAKQCTEDLGYALDAEETSRIVKEHRLKTGTANQGKGADAKYDFHIVVGRGENLYSKNLATPADAFVSVFESGNTTRLHKTSTVMSRIDPIWEEEFHYAVPSARILEINCFNRSLVGKNELIGSATVKLNPVAYRETPIRDIALPLNPRGTIHIRVELQNGEMHEVNYHLNKAKRMLDRVANDMVRNLIDKVRVPTEQAKSRGQLIHPPTFAVQMSEFIQMQLSVIRLRELIKPLTAKPKKGVPKLLALSNEEYEQSLAPLFDYFDTCFSTFHVTFPDALRIDVMSAIWKRVVGILLSLLIPPLSDKESHADPLSPPEITVVFQWLKLLKSFFNASEDGQEHGVPRSALQAGGYRDILLIGQYLDLPTPSLKEKCTAAIKSVGRSASQNAAAARPSLQPAASSLSIGGEVGLNDEERMAELLLRVLRMRPQTQEFLTQHISQLNQARAIKNNQ